MHLENTALQMAVAHHAGQVRRFTGVPYHTHPQEVADCLRVMSQRLSSDSVERLVCAGLLHDTLEDSTLLGSPTSAGYAELRKSYEKQLRTTFGVVVHQVVRDVTKPLAFSRRSDCLLYVLADIQKWSVESCCVKLADIYCNLLDYPTGRNSRPYVREKAKQVAAIFARLEAFDAADKTVVVAYRLLALALGTFDRLK